LTTSRAGEMSLQWLPSSKPIKKFRLSSEETPGQELEGGEEGD